MATKISTPRLRIAVLIRHYTRIGGAERYCVELTERLAKHHEVHLFCQAIETGLHPDITLHTIRKKRDKPRYINQLEFSRWTRLATEDQFDIIHSHDMVTHANVQTLHVPCVLSRYTELSGYKKKLRWLNTIISPRLLAYLWLERKQICSKNQRQIIAVSEFLARNITHSYPEIVHNIHIAYPGIHITQPESSQIAQRKKQRDKLQLLSSDFVLLFVANDYQRKGLLVLLETLKTIHNPSIHLVVAGDDKPDKFAEPVATAGLKNQVHFIGKCHDMQALYPIADILVHPTLADTYAMVVLEAMAHSIPVIVSNASYCGFSEHLSADEAILISDPKDHTEIARHINTLLTDNKLRESLAKSAKNKTLSIRWEETMEQTLIAYRKVLAIDSEPE